MDFFKTIKESIYSPSFYKAIPQKTLWQAVKYFIILILLLTVISILTLFQNLFIETPKIIRDYTQKTINCFPDDLEIKITNGEVSTNVGEPYFIADCDPLSDVEGTKIAVIDTKTPFAQAKFEEYNSFIWVTKDSVSVKDKGYQTRIYSLKGAQNFTLTKQSIDSFYNRFSPYFKWIGPVILALTFFGIFIVYLLRFIQLFITSALIWLLGKIFKHELNYSTSYKVSLFASTLGLIVDLIVSTTSQYTHFYGFPFMFTFLTLGIVVINLFLPKQASK